MEQDCLTTREVAFLLDTDVRQILRRADREGWESRPRAGRGGGRDWIIASMPKATQRAVGYASICKPFRRETAPAPATESSPSLPFVNSPTALPATMPNAPHLADTGKLTAKQRDVMLARRAILNEVARLGSGGRMSKRDAIQSLERAWKEGTLDEGLRQTAIAANDKTGSAKDRGLSYATVYRWLKAFEEGGELALAPKLPSPNMGIPEWAPAFLAIWQVPSKPSVSDAYRQFAGAYTGKLPSSFAVRRFLNKMAKPDREAGRVTGNAMLKLRPHKLRKTDEFWPGDIYTADGTTFDAAVQHPVHGQRFRPEVTLVVDVATRRCVGLSVGESESAYTVLDALRVACIFGGIPCYFYTDNGPGYKNTLMTSEGRGIMARLDIQMTNSIPGRPQGKGLMERAVQTICVSASKRLPSCTHADMDRDACKKVLKITKADLKTHGKSPLLPSFEEFKEVLLKRVDEYNATPHRSLPKIADLATGKRRNMSPDEYWMSFRERGFMPESVPEAIRDELFMPGVPRKVANGMVQFFNEKYFAQELADFHGDWIEVRYDIWDSSRVFCWTTKGEKICVAELDGNAMGYFPRTQMEIARERRANGQVARLKEKIQCVAPGATVHLPEAPLSCTTMVDSFMRPTPEPVAADNPASEPALDAVNLAPGRRPIFRYKEDRYRWLLENPGRWNDTDLEWIREHVASAEYEELRDYYADRGLAWDESRACCSK